MKIERPQQQGLYSPEFEHENCGIGFVAHLKGEKSHSIISKGLEILCNMTHRGAEGSDSKTGDGAGVLIQVPYNSYLELGYSLPPEGDLTWRNTKLPVYTSKRCWASRSRSRP